MTCVRFATTAEDTPMPVENLTKLLDEKGVPYLCLRHPATYTAQRTAQATHIKGKEMAKTVILKVDGVMSMVVLPATAKVDLEHIREAIGAQKVELASESEFQSRFPHCEVGAMPPFGNLYGMGVFVDAHLAEDEVIAFNAGNHCEVIRLSYANFDELVKPNVGAYAA